MAEIHSLKRAPQLRDTCAPLLEAKHDLRSIAHQAETAVLLLDRDAPSEIVRQSVRMVMCGVWGVINDLDVAAAEVCHA